MILPTPRADGTFETNYGSDVRIPDVPFTFDRDDELDHWTQPRNLDGMHTYRVYPDGFHAPAKCRHLFDVITSTKTHVHYDDDEHELLDTEFRQILTCVSCGYVIKQAGTLNQADLYKTHEIDPAPISAGTLRAQQTSAQRYRETWSVHDYAGARIGSLSWGSTTRGREYFTGSFTAEGSQPVEGATALATLRKLAKQVA